MSGAAHFEEERQYPRLASYRGPISQAYEQDERKISRYSLLSSWAQRRVVQYEQE